MCPDQRIAAIKNKLAGLSAWCKNEGLAAANKSEIAEVVAALNGLTEELTSCLQQQKEQKDRLNHLMDVLVKYTQMDFSAKSPISHKRDEIDALSAGLNTMGEELAFYTQKLKESKERLRTIITYAPDAIITIDSAGLITTWNPAAVKIFGWAEHEALRQPVHTLLIPEAYRESHLRGIERFLKTGEGAVVYKTLQLPALRKDLSIVDIELTISPTQLKNEQIFIAFLRDITERKRAEEAILKFNATLERRVQERTEALQRSQQKYRHLFENSPLPMWLLELPTLQFIDVNESAIKHYGYSREEFLSMTAIDIRPDDEKIRYQQMAHPMKVGTKNMGGWRHLKKDGSVIHVEVSVHDIEYEGKMARLVIANDITEKVRAEEALRQSEERFRRIYEAKMVGFVFWDASGEISDANDAFLELVGYTRKDLQEGKLKWSSLTPPEYAETDKAALNEIALSGSCQPFEKEYIRKDGVRIPVLIGGAALDQGVVEKGVAYILDISERKKMESEIRKLNKDLEKRVKVRTEQLELVNKELESFTYSVSHDLRAPLRAIHGFSEILLEEYTDKLEDKGTRLLQIVMKNAHKMGTLIDELLEFSRLGKKDVKRTQIDLDQIVEEVVKEASQTFTHHALITTQPLGTAAADFTLVKLVFQNLIMNAIKYSSKKEAPEITIGVLNDGGSKAYYVKDNGAGFDMTYYNKLFGVFQRLHRQEEFVGNGVGLAIVQRIVAKHGGKVWAEGKLNEGATFYFTLES